MNNARKSRDNLFFEYSSLRKKKRKRQEKNSNAIQEIITEYLIKKSGSINPVPVNKEGYMKLDAQRLDGTYSDMILYGILRDEWLS